MRVLVCGGRAFADRTLLEQTLDRLHTARRFTTVIEGDAAGADRLAGDWAHTRGVALEVFQADWDGLGPKAGPMRNAQMLVEGRPELVVAFPGRRGTAHMIRLAQDAGVEVIQIPGD